MTHHQHHHDRPKHTERQERSGKVLVDGSNVAHSSEGEKARLRNIELVVQKLEGEGLEPIVVADAALRHQIDEVDRYEALLEEGHIRQAPAGTDADYFILSFARELDANIVSNDRFRDRLDAFPDARDRIIRYMIVADEVARYEKLLDDGQIRQAPAGTDADYFILAFARELDAFIVSNDRFRDRQDAFPDARDRMIRYMIVADEVVFERRNRKR